MISTEMRYMVGQMLIAGFPSPEVDDQARRLVDELCLGNFYYFARNIKSARQCAGLSRDISDLVYKKVGVSPLIGTDQEGGIVSRLVEGAALTPGAAAVGAAVLGMQKDVERRYPKVEKKLMDAPLLTVETMGRNSGRILRACGISMTAAPDMDVNIEPANPIIGARSYGDDPEQVSRVSVAQMKGFASGGVLPMIKHFPGHGNVKSDSHLGIPVNDTPAETLRKTEFSTFEKAIRSGAEALMTAHVRYTQVDAENPATLSKTIMTDMLRGDFGFTGIAGTDCLEMDAIRAAYGVGEGAVRAIEAGVDLLTISHTYDAVSEAVHAIYDAIESGRISEDRIRLSFDRIMKVKRKYGLMGPQKIDPDEAQKMVDSVSSQIVCDDLMARAITLLRGSFDVDLAGGDYLVVGCDQTPSTGVEDMKQLSFADSMAEEYGCEAMALPINMDPETSGKTAQLLREKVEAMAAEKGAPVPLILGLYNARFRDGQKRMVEAVRELAKEGKVTWNVVLFGAPYDLPLVEDADCVVTTYEYTRLSLKALIGAIRSGSFPGVSPFKV